MRRTLSRKIIVSLAVLVSFGFFYFFRETTFRKYVDSAAGAKQAGDEAAAMKDYIFASALDERGRADGKSIERAESFYGRGDYVSAERELAPALADGEGTSALNGWMGRVKNAEGDYAAAEKYFAKEFTLEPTAESAIERSLNLMRDGKFAEAEMALQAAQQKTSNEDIAYYLGLVKWDEGKYSSDDFASIRNGKYAGEIAAVEDYIERAHDVAHADSDYSLVSRADLFRGLGEVELAFANLDIVLKRNDKYCDAYLVSGKTFIAIGNYTSAKEAFEKCLILDVDNAEAVFYLSKLYEASGDREKAAEFADRYESLVK